MEEGKRGPRIEEEMVEAALAAAGAALFVSGMKHLLPFLPCSCALSAALVMAPSPFLFLLLNVVVASIVVVSLRPARSLGVERKKATSKIDGEKEKFEERSATAAETEAEAEAEAEADEEGGVEAEELNRRAEAFIAAFRRQLSADSFSSGAAAGANAQ
ncbi:uncharacterized protein LOC109727706 [Ananas comosus]|uniref:Uncharacterized protein LOC109727706 n=1 Tax=Ananas comosus TaxID=4615 RepID=A0A6P5H0B9_ANACO|nr:uncharacterized protein LOC109727706 [Ananas comosus]